MKQDQFQLDLSSHRAYYSVRCIICGWQATAGRDNAAGFWNMMDVHKRLHCELG